MMSGRSGGAYVDISRRVVPLAVTTLLVTYVGGPSLAVLMGSVFLTAVALQRRVEFRGTVGVLAGVVLNLAWLSIYMGIVLPWSLRVPGVRGLIAHPLVENGFRPPAYAQTSVGLYWLGSLLVLGAPGIVSYFVLARGRAWYLPLREPVLGRLAWLAALAPVVIVAVLKWSQPWLAVAFTMGGDGRNQFLSIEEIRATASGFPRPWTLTTPLLSNAIGALLSSGNGSSGTLQRGDLFAMLSVYVLSASMLIAATMTGFISSVAGRTKTHWMALPLVGTSFLLATNSFVLSTSLHDGFMSLYFGAAVLGTSLVLAAVVPVGGAKIFVLSCGLLVQIGAYTFLAPVLGVVLLVEIYRWIWTVTAGRLRAKVLGMWSLLMISVLSVTLYRSWHAFEVIAIIPGAIAPIESVIVWLMLAVAICLCCLRAGESRAAGLTAAVALATCLFVLFLIERLEVNIAPGNSYYGSKTIVGTVGGVLCLSYIPLGGALASLNPQRMRRLVAIAGLTAGALVPVVITDDASTLPRPWLEARRGRAFPDDVSIEEVVERWGDEPYLFFRFADNPPDVEYPDVAADRTLNFWTPTVWGRTGYWLSMWLWVYNEMGTLDAAVLCSPVHTGVQTIYTRDPALRGEVEVACGSTDAKFVVLPRLSSP